MILAAGESLADLIIWSDGSIYLAVLADPSGLSVPVLSMAENGQRPHPGRDHVNALAVALRVAPAEIAPSTLPDRTNGDRRLPRPRWYSRRPRMRSPLPGTGTWPPEFTGYVIRGDRYAAGVWLRRLARDPGVRPLAAARPAPHAGDRPVRPASAWGRDAPGIRRRHRTGAGRMTAP